MQKSPRHTRLTDLAPREPGHLLGGRLARVDSLRSFAKSRSTAAAPVPRDRVTFTYHHFHN